MVNKTNATYLLIIILFTAVCYSGALSFQFTNWDDIALVVENRTIQHLDGAMLKRVFTQTTGPDYLPLKEISYAVDYAIWRENPFGYHLTNLLLYIIFIVAVFYFSKRITGEANTAFLGVFLFALHPSHAEIVCWISARKDLLSGIFIFTALIFFLKAFDEGNKRRFARFYCISLLASLFALLSKPVSVVIPLYLVFLLIYSHPASSEKAKQYMAVIPFFILSFLITITTIVIGVGKGTVKEWDIGKSLKALLEFPSLLLWYVKKLFLPFNLSPLYEERMLSDEISAKSIIVFIVFVLALFLILKKGGKLSGFFTLWFVASILPVSGIIPISISKADRYLFLPSFVIVCVTKYFTDLEKARTGKRIAPAKKRLSPAAVFLVALFFFVISVMQSSIWKDSAALWEYAVSRYPGVSAIRNNLGNSYYSKGNVLKAKVEFIRAVALDAKNWKAHSNLGEIFREEGKSDAALKEYESALQIRDNDADLLTRAGNLYRKEGNYEKSEKLLKSAIEADKNYFPAYAGLAGTLAQSGRYDEAKSVLDEALIRGIADRRIDVMFEALRKRGKKKYTDE